MYSSRMQKRGAFKGNRNWKQGGQRYNGNLSINK